MFPLCPEIAQRWFVPAQSGTGLVPAANYLLKFYEAGTDTPKSVYDGDDTVYPDPGSVVILNSEGYAVASGGAVGVRLGTGAYKVRVCEPEVTPSPSGGTAVYTLDNIDGNGSFGTGFVDTVYDPSPDAGLKAADTTANKFVFCGGYQAIGDGGHGFFWNKASSTAGDGGYIIASTVDTAKRWFRIPDESGDVRAASFGYIGTLAQNLNTQFAAAAAYANANDLRLVVGPGSAATIGVNGADLSVHAAEIHLEPGAVLKAVTGAHKIQLYGIVTGYNEVHFSGWTGIVFNTPQVLSQPWWFGAAPTSENTAAFTAWLASQPVAGAFILPPGDWKVTNGGSWPCGATQPILMYGRVVGVDDVIVPTGYYGTDDSQLRFFRLLFKNGVTLDSAAAGKVLLTGEMDITGLLAVTGAMTATSDITGLNLTGTNSVTSDGNVIAGGPGVAGKMLFRAGTSVKQTAGGGQYTQDITAYPSSGTTLQDLGIVSIIAHSLTTEGDRLRLTVGGGYTADNTSSQLFEILIGAVNVAPLTIVSMLVDGNWKLVLDIWKTSTGVKCLSSLSVCGIAGGVANAKTAYVADTTLDWTTTLTLHVKVQVTAFGVITQQVLGLEYFPAN
jgi:hypothetical protein